MALIGDQPERKRRSAKDDLRELTDARTLRALAHPVRIALIEVLGLRGPMTATEAGEQIGESPTTCSFHLRQLAKYGFVEEAGGGKGRSRPWKVVTLGLRVSENTGDLATDLAASELTRIWRQRVLDRYRNWLETRPAYPERWRKAADESEHIIYLTADELEALNEKLLALVLPQYRERLTDPSVRPPGAVPVEVLTLTFPLEPPAENN